MKNRFLLIVMVLTFAPLSSALAAGDAEKAPKQDWHFSGMTGT